MKDCPECGTPFFYMKKYILEMGEEPSEDVQGVAIVGTCPNVDCMCEAYDSKNLSINQFNEMMEKGEEMKGKYE